MPHLNEQTPRAPFRLGCIYRQLNGELVKLDTISEDGTWANGVMLTGRYKGETCGLRRLSDGHCIVHTDNYAYGSNIQPGELNAQGEPIAPTFYCTAETLKPATTANEIIRRAWERLGANYAANRIQRQEADMPDGWACIGYDLAAGAVVITTNKPVAEKLRPRLTWADSKAADPFAGYVTTRDTATPDHAYSHPLTRVADAGAQVSAEFGSAWLVVR